MRTQVRWFVVILIVKIIVANKFILGELKMKAKFEVTLIIDVDYESDVRTFLNSLDAFKYSIKSITDLNPEFKPEVTKEQFAAYLEVQKSGVINMWDTCKVCALADEVLTRGDCIYIMKNYDALSKHYEIK